MFESRDDSRLNLFSGYMSLIVAFAVSGIVFILFMFENESIYGYLNVQDLNKSNTMISMAGIIVVFLLFNTSYYALISYYHQRMLVMSTAFLGAGCIQLLGIAHGYPDLLQVDGVMVQELIYGTIPRLLMAFGIFLGSTMDYENQLEFGNPRIVKLIPVIMAGAILWLDQFLNGVITVQPPETDLRLLQMLLEYMTAGAYILAVVSYLRFYSLKKNRFLLHSASGLLVLVFAHALQIAYGLPPDLTSIAFESFQIVGLAIFFIAMFRNNIDIPLAELVNAEKQIKLYAENLEKIVERRTAEIRQVNARFIREMDYARSIQQSLLPLKRLNFKKVAFYSEYFPCERLSGDFYDIYRIDDDHVGMYVLDVSGHGISAALMTMFCNNYIKSTERLIKRYRGLKPHRNLKHFYEEFNKMNFPEEMHMVIFFASYNLTTQVLTYSSGGMNCNPILVRSDGTWEYLDKSKGFPICRLSDFFEPEYTSEFIHLQDGDRLIFYTDGLVDKDKNRIFDQEELVELMLKYREKPAKTLNRALTDRIGNVAAQLDDDVTYFIMDIGLS